MDYKKAVKESTEKILKMGRDKADLDPIRPEYHFHSPAMWMDDPNGIIYYDGYYHMMYSLNPDTDKWRAGMVYKTGSSIWKTSEPDWTGGITVWGHARSKDLIHWEHLPVALYPDIEHDEYYIWFGCTAINDEGVPVAIYTSIGYENRNPTDSAIQHIWFGDKDLINWTPATETNPVMTEDLHNGKKIWEWRDPFLFRQNGKAYLILGGKQDKSDGDKAVVLLYEAQNKSFTKWSYKGILFEFPRTNLRSVECPNIVQLGGHWVLLTSPHGPVEYFVGDLDAEKCKFHWFRHGVVDFSAHFYATNVLEDGNGRKLMWGAVEGFDGTSGWNGINSLPREITLDDKNEMVQKPAKELEMLRSGENVLDKDGEITVLMGTIECQILFNNGIYGKVSIENNEIVIYNDAIIVENHYVPLNQSLKEHKLRVFVDKSVMEVFIDEHNCYTAMLTPITDKCRVKVSGDGIVVTVWELNTKGLFAIYSAEE